MEHTLTRYGRGLDSELPSLHRSAEVRYSIVPQVISRVLEILYKNIIFMYVKFTILVVFTFEQESQPEVDSLKEEVAKLQKGYL